MIIEFDSKRYEDKRQALCELAFCHFPVRITIDGRECVFEEFSALEEYLKNY